MIYLDNGATSFWKPKAVGEAMLCALENCGNPGRGGYQASMAGAKVLLRCRERAGDFFDCDPEQVALTGSCTQGLNMAIQTLVRPGDRVVISGFEHNAVVRPLHGLGAQILVSGRRLFHWADTLEAFEKALKTKPAAAVFTQVSNVFGYVLPVAEMAALCRQYSVPFVIDAAQGAGVLPLSFRQLGAAFVAMPGHKGLLGPMGTGLLLCGAMPKPLFRGGTGSNSASREMPDFLPDIAEAGTANVPGFAGLSAALAYLQRQDLAARFRGQCRQVQRCAEGLQVLGFQVFAGSHQGGTLSFLPNMDCEEAAHILAQRGIAVRAGLHCAPLAHESAGTLQTGTVRISFGHDGDFSQTASFLQAAKNLV